MTNVGIYHQISNYERQEQIEKFVEQRQRASVADISIHFSISPATVRRDIVILADKGRIRRVRGGAITLRVAPPEPPILKRSEEKAEEKDRIGKVAASLVNEGETVFLGSGTTVLKIAHYLRNHRNLTVITNSLLVMSALQETPDITIVCPGGILRRGESSLIGHIVEHSLEDLRADKIFMGVRALDYANGLSSDYLPEILTDRAIMKTSDHLIVVADHTKFGRVSSVVVAPITAVNTLITDLGAPVVLMQKLKELGISILLA